MFYIQEKLILLDFYLFVEGAGLPIFIKSHVSNLQQIRFLKRGKKKEMLCVCVCVCERERERERYRV